MIAAALLMLQAAAQSHPGVGDWARDSAFNGPAACSREEVYNGIRVIAYLGDRSCVRFKPQRRYAGLWVNAFEGQLFLEGADSRRDLVGHRLDVWFSEDEQTRHDEAVACPRQHICRIVFDGKEAVDMHRRVLEGYGHMSGSPGLVLAERIVSIEDLGPADRG